MKLRRNPPAPDAARPGRLPFLVIAAVLGLLAGCSALGRPVTDAAVVGVNPTADIHSIRHVIIIMQENRSFDHYFGTFPGADGIPMRNGQPAVCLPDPAANTCSQPYHDPNDVNDGGPHQAQNAVADINGGKMDGFVAQAAAGRQRACSDPNDPQCTQAGGPQAKPDVMGWHDAREIPNYWRYAQEFVLQDRMFEPNASWSLPAHLFMVSGWSAKCTRRDDLMSCRTSYKTRSSLPIRLCGRSRPHPPSKGRIMPGPISRTCFTGTT